MTTGKITFFLNQTTLNFEDYYSLDDCATFNTLDGITGVTVFEVIKVEDTYIFSTLNNSTNIPLIYLTKDLVSYQTASLAANSQTPTQFIYGNGILVGSSVGGSGFLTYTNTPTSTSTWNRINTGLFTPFSRFTFNGSQFVGVGTSTTPQQLHVSSNITDWSLLGNLPNEIYNVINIEYLNNAYYIINIPAYNINNVVGNIWRSTDGLSWTKVHDIVNTSSSPSINQTKTRIIYENSKFVFNSNNILVYSSDGITWTTSSNISNFLADSGSTIKYQSNSFIQLASGPGYATSSDLINWTNGTNAPNTLTSFTSSYNLKVAPAILDPTIPTASITVTRDNTNNQAIINCNQGIANATLWESSKLEYRLTDLDSEWITLSQLPPISTVRTHTNSKGYFTNGNLEYRIKINFNGEEYFSNTFILSGVKLARYDLNKTVSGFKIDELIHNEATNEIEATFRLPQPTSLAPASTAVRGLQYRMTDIKTGITVNTSTTSIGENKVTFPYASIESVLSGLFPVLYSTEPARLRYVFTRLVNGIQTVSGFLLGEKGIRIEWGWTELDRKSELPTKFTKDVNNYGYLVFYPKFEGTAPVLPPGDDVEHKPDSPQGNTGGPGEIKTPAGKTGDPGGGDTGNTGVGVVDPIDVKPIIIVTPIEDGQICLTDENGINLACGILPPGTPPNPFITIRKDEDNIYIIYDGRVVVSYKIDPVKFPNLQNSQGWVGFFDLQTNEQVVAPEGSIVNWLPEEGSDYEVNAFEIEYGLSRKRPFIYGTYEQGYTLIINGTNVSVEMEPLHDDLIAADFYITGGTTVQVTPEIATIIANAGYSKYLRVVR